MLERPLPDAQVGWHDEVGDDEDEGLRGEIPLVLAEEVEPARDGVGRCGERTDERSRLGARLRARRPPERLAACEVEVAGQAARGPRACADQLERGDESARLVQGAQIRCGNRHRRAVVEEHDDAGRLVGEALADDELVATARGGEARRCGPVHPRDVVARAVLARARDVVADAAPRTAHAAEREPHHPPPRNERARRKGIANGNLRSAATELTLFLARAYGSICARSRGFRVHTITERSAIYGDLSSGEGEKVIESVGNRCSKASAEPTSRRISPRKHVRGI